RRHTRCYRDWSSDVCSSDLALAGALGVAAARRSPAAGTDGPPTTAETPATGESPDSPEVLLGQLQVEPLELELAGDLFDLVDPEIGRASCRERGGCARETRA